MKSDYLELLKRKANTALDRVGIKDADIHPSLFPFQKDVVEMLLQVGRGAAFLDTGLGKTIVQCEWARHIPGEVLIVAPLAVAHQTVREAHDKLGMEIAYSKTGTVSTRVTITNYERVHLFDCSRFAGVVLDESSILKGRSSKTKEHLCSTFEKTPYRLACTATPAPNDYTELGNHAEFLGIMNTQEMLTRWFIHDSANTADWRLKGHAVKPFWQWVSSWAACVSKPSDLGYTNEGYDLPKLTVKTHTVSTPTEECWDKGMLFEMADSTSATSLHAEKRKTVEDRVAVVAGMVNASDEPWIVWCESNQESEMLAKAIPDAVEVKGSDSPDRKEAVAMWFSGYELAEKDLHLIGKLSNVDEWKSSHINKNTTVKIETADLRNLRNMTKCTNHAEGSVKFADLLMMETQRISLTSITAIQQEKCEVCYVANATLDSGTFKTILTECDLQSIIFSRRIIISKSSIFGHGMNWQHCRNIAFASISYSYERFYQAIRRSWRFGQTMPVNVHVVIAEAEIPVWRTVEEKATDHEMMKDHMKYATFSKGVESKVKLDYNPTHKAKLPEWLA